MQALRRSSVAARQTRPQKKRVPLLSNTQLRVVSTHVSVIGLHWKTDETRLQEVFAAYGRLEKAQIVTPEHSSMHLWASLVYATFDEALAAVSEWNGQELDGRLLRLSIVDPPVGSESVAEDTT